ncbi:serine/threonine-protein kinase [Leptolyngbya sp. O-77]|uniref:serine/threonine-protein kinase n=1 Tax=Leptolyngbya sp. O-77 TaxID=1080068 RepID=UPI00074D2A07|nr:Serine/threonine-protein kinase F [Leptolyngbya sp. O-77]
MEVYCTRFGCPRPQNHFADLDDSSTLRTVQQKFCTTCGMPLLLQGRYIPQKLLGKGGFGAAFLARDRYTPAMRQCVVKQFQPSGDLSPNQLQVAQTLFQREAEVLEQLGSNHPQIPNLLAFFELEVPSLVPGRTDRFFYLVQEFIDGKDLEQELEQRGAFSESEVLEVLEEVLKVLDYVHANGSIHRDIKLSNIMRRRDGRLFLLDFGAVKQVTAAAVSTGGRASTGIYSMGFAPPEQMRGDQVYPATDLYALAVTCITLLTGKQPNELYDAYSNHWNWRSHLSTPVSDRLADVLNKMLLPTPSQRFQSAQEVREALRAVSPASHPGQPAHAGQGFPVTSAPLATGTGATSLQSAPAAQPAPVSSAPAASPPAAVSPSTPTVAPFSLMEFLGGALFTGFEGGLVAIALLSLLGTTIVSPVFWVPLLGIVIGLIFAQSRRWIERNDLLIIAGITLALVAFTPLRRGLAIIATPSLPNIFMLAIFAGLLAVFVGIVFRLVYLALSRIL